MLNPQYALAVQVPPEDERVKAERFDYASPDGHGVMQGLMARPAAAEGKLPAVLVVHENRGLNPYVEDVVRRLAVAGDLALGPDALYPLGGYPGTDDEGRTMQRTMDRAKITEDFVAAARVLQDHPDSTGKVGVVGFCFGGGMLNTLAWRLPEVIAAAVPYYGGQPSAEQAAKIKAPLLLHYAELDKRVNAGWPTY
ncbi:MAG: dienelactone hydrolase family protein [Candidatus Synoicihabitans palmerolidicus]|nr:dienelactone hydrolase family protein [Candidatus Synoicihabitans palmerolidicus]